MNWKVLDQLGPKPEWPELPEMLWKVGKMIEDFEATSRVLLTLNDYLPAGTLQNNLRLYRVRDALVTILGPEPPVEKAADASVSGGYPASPPSKG